MSFQPVLAGTGYAGWKFLERTLFDQKQAYSSASVNQREVEEFRQKINNISSAEELVADRTVLKVALGAFGLESDLQNKFFIRKVLEEGSLDSDALANKLADTRYRKFSSAFGFGPGSIRGALDPDFSDKIATAYLDRSFEVELGQQDENMRLALNLQRDLAEISGSDSSENTKWFSVMGQPPLRQVFETALGLPSSFAALDIDQQLGVFKERSAAFFGNGKIEEFDQPEMLEKITRLFLVRSELNGQTNGLASGSSVALALLQN